MARKKLKPDPKPSISFRFMADQYGFSSAALRADTEFAREVIGAVDAWARAVETLFGNVEIALACAAEARLLPTYPEWPTIDNLRETVRHQLATAWSESEAIDTAARRAVEELRLYLEDLSDWAETFEAGVWAATVAGSGSSTASDRIRRLEGIEAIRAVYDFDAAAPADFVRAELARLRSVPSALISSEAAAAAFPPNRFAMTSASSRGMHEPSLITQWLTRVVTDGEAMTADVETLRSQPAWQQIESAYWHQWNWPPSGTPKRNTDFPEITVLDLIYATRHGNIPVVPPRGRRLSVSQWSRIARLGLLPGHKVPSEIFSSAMGNLGLPADLRWRDKSQ
jgi:hypothetical protein